MDIEGLENNVVISTKIVDRPNDRLVMSGWVKNSLQSGTDPEGYCVINPSGTNNISTIKLVRVDARVTFNISLDKQSDRTNIIEKSFTPLKFIVKNVPTKAIYMVKRTTNWFRIVNISLLIMGSLLILRQKMKMEFLLSPSI